MNQHCSSIKRISDSSVLYRFIDELDDTDFKNQKQLPNPTMIDTVVIGKAQVEARNVSRSYRFIRKTQSKFAISQIN